MPTTQQYQDLNTELTTDPLSRGYSGMTDAQAADDLNTVYRPAEVPVPGLEADIRRFGLWTRYREKAEAKDQDGAYLNSAMREFMDLFYSSLNQASTRTSDSYMNDLIDRMVAEGSMGAAAGEQLKAYDNNRQSRGSEIGFGNVTDADVTVARAL